MKANFIFATGNPDFLNNPHRRYHIVENKPTPELTDAQRELNDAKLAERDRAVEISATYGETATRVAPYTPNRAQRRAQAAVKRKTRSK